MKNMRKIFFILTLSILLMNVASAQGILPSGPTGGDAGIQCENIKDTLKNEKVFNDRINEITESEGRKQFLNFVLGCAIKTGRIRLFMVPFFIVYIIQFLLSIAGIISVGFMVIGGYKYTVGGLIEDKESGKKTILYALVGLIVALSSWIVVNFIQVALTS